LRFVDRSYLLTALAPGACGRYAAAALRCATARLAPLPLLAGIGSALALPPAGAHGGPADEPAPAITAPAAPLRPAWPGDWTNALRSTVEDALAPVYAGVGELLRPMRNLERLWSGTARLEPVDPPAARYWQAFAPLSADRFAAGSTRLDAVTSTGPGASLGMSLHHARLPWLVTPENATRAMAALSLAGSGPLHMELMAGNVGGWGGTSAAFVQLVYRF
jgi:hypothetical protein